MDRRQRIAVYSENKAMRNTAAVLKTVFNDKARGV